MCDTINLIRNIAKIAYITYNVEQAYEAYGKLQQNDDQNTNEIANELEVTEMCNILEEQLEDEDDANEIEGVELCNIMQKQECDFSTASRMSVESYEILKTLLYDKISAIGHVVNWQTRLDITILHLAHNINRKAVASTYKISAYHVPKIVAQVSDIIYEELMDVCLKPASADDWLELAKKMSTQTKLTHCLGAIETRLVTLNDDHHSVRLLLSCNTDLCFTTLHVSKDKNPKKKSAGVKPVPTIQLPKPQMAIDLNCELPFYFVSSDRLTVGDYILQTYNEPAADKRKFFNLYANDFIGSMHVALGIMQRRWKFFENWKISKDTKYAVKQISACVMIHNLLILLQDTEYFVDTTINRNEIAIKLKPSTDYMPSEAATELRNQLKTRLFS